MITSFKDHITITNYNVYTDILDLLYIIEKKRKKNYNILYIDIDILYPSIYELVEYIHEKYSINVVINYKYTMYYATLDNKKIKK